MPTQDTTPLATTCQRCGGPIHRNRPSWNRRFCSVSCARRSPLSIEERFWSQVDRSGGDNACWLWAGYAARRGYGRIKIDGVWVSAHRLAWQIANGPIPDGMLVCHHCDNPPCVNPAHLFLGTDADNTADRDAKGRQVKWERVNTAKLSWEQVREVRQRAASGESLRSLAREYGVSTGAIHPIIRGKSWRE